ncbi:oligopeptide/dipeptide ABC transporter ATP-binding protein [Coprococcus sp. RTP21204st1_G4_RTP21204_210225]
MSNIPREGPVGCKFASRCPYATKRCHEERPIFRNVGNEHYVACHLVE